MIDLAHASHLPAQIELVEPAPERYVAAFRAAEQVTLAVITASRVRTRGRHDVWELLAHRVPELGEWAAFFSYLAPRVEVVAAGARAIVGEREADDLVRDLARFTAEALAYVRRATAARSPVRQEVS